MFFAQSGNFLQKPSVPHPVYFSQLFFFFPVLIEIGGCTDALLAHFTDSLALNPTCT